MAVNPPLLDPVRLQVLHAITLPFSYFGIMHFIANWAPEEIAAEAQSFSSAMTQGFSVVTLLVFGWLVGMIGGEAYFVAGGMALVGAGSRRGGRCGCGRRTAGTRRWRMPERKGWLTPELRATAYYFTFFMTSGAATTYGGIWFSQEQGADRRARSASSIRCPPSSCWCSTCSSAASPTRRATGGR